MPPLTRVILPILLSFPAVAQTGPARTINFASDVHPILETRCRSCHTGDAAQARLRIDSRDNLLKGGKTGPAIEPGKASDSLLIHRVTGQRGLRMPPSGPPLNDDAIATLRQWIDQGASWDTAARAPDRLAPIAPRRPQLPTGAAANPMDRFAPLIAEPISDALFGGRV